MPTTQASDNHQAIRYQSKALPIGDCKVCHDSSRGGGDISEFQSAHGGTRATACAVCHNEDFSLQRSKLETCTLCHAQTSHAGSDEHLRASPAAVKIVAAVANPPSPLLPTWPGTPITV